MTGRSAAAGLVWLSLVAGCGERTTARPHEHGHEHEAEQEHGGAEKGLLRVAPEMLRDLRVTTARAEARSAGETVAVLGELRVDEDAYAEIGAPVPARIVKTLAGVGDSVRPGQPVVELHSPELGRARAEFLAASARAEFAARTLARKRALAAERIAPAAEVEAAEAEAARTRAELEAARAALGTFGPGAGDAARILLRSPIAGTVIERSAVRGQLADPARPLYRIGDLSALWLTVHAFERDAVRLRPGVAARITFPALPGQSFSGAVILIGKEVDTASRTIPVRIAVRNPQGLLRPGMSASASIPLGDAAGTVVTVPVAAVQRVEDNWCVFLPRRPGLYEVRPVGRGRELAGAVEILNGLRTGETVVVEGAFLLKAEVEKAHGEGGHEH